MSFPVPGDTGVQGVVAYIDYVPGLGIWVGAVEAFASIYGTPPAYQPNPNRFTFESATEILPGQITFDVVAGLYANYATNVQNA